MSSIQEAMADGTRRLLNRLGENRFTGWLYWLFPYRKLDIPLERWENEYLKGDWKRLNNFQELGRYGVISAYCHQMGSEGRILDIGCGEGILLDHLGAESHAHYTGIDISSEAIAAAEKRHSGSGAQFTVADTYSFEAEEYFDIIVFNECLYYFDDSLQILEKYAGMLAPGGIILVSMYASPRTRRIWSLLQRRFKPTDSVRLENESGNAWTIKLFAT